MSVFFYCTKVDIKQNASAYDACADAHFVCFFPPCSPHVFWFFSVSPSHIILSLALLSVIILTLSFAFFFTLCEFEKISFLVSFCSRSYHTFSQLSDAPSQRRNFLPFNCFFIIFLSYFFSHYRENSSHGANISFIENDPGVCKGFMASVINVRKRSPLIPHHIIRHC